MVRHADYKLSHHGHFKCDCRQTARTVVRERMDGVTSMSRISRTLTVAEALYFGHEDIEARSLLFDASAHGESPSLTMAEGAVI